MSPPPPACLPLLFTHHSGFQEARRPSSPHSPVSVSESFMLTLPCWQCLWGYQSVLHLTGLSMCLTLPLNLRSSAFGTRDQFRGRQFFHSRGAHSLLSSKSAICISLILHQSSWLSLKQLGKFLWFKALMCLGKMDTCICMSESLWCPPETITLLLISYKI